MAGGRASDKRLFGPCVQTNTCYKVLTFTIWNEWKAAHDLSCEFHADFVERLLCSSVWNCREEGSSERMFFWSVPIDPKHPVVFVCRSPIRRFRDVESFENFEKPRSARTVRIAMSSNNGFVYFEQSRIIYQLRKHEKGKNVSEGTAKAELWYHQHKIKTKISSVFSLGNRWNVS